MLSLLFVLDTDVNYMLHCPPPSFASASVAVLSALHCWVVRMVRPAIAFVVAGRLLVHSSASVVADLGRFHVCRAGPAVQG